MEHLSETLRKVKILKSGKYVESSFSDIRKGDVFILIEPGGKHVGIYRADSGPYKFSIFDSVLTIDTIDMRFLENR